MPGTMEKEQQGKPTPTESAATGKTGKFSRPIADELEPEVLEEPRSRKEIEALGAPETAAVPLSQLKSMVTKTVNASSKLVAEAAMNLDIAPTENSLELLHAAMELLKTDKILTIDDTINEAVENNPILNDPNFKHQYIQLLQQHAVNKTIEEAKSCNQEAYVLLDKTIELHKKHLATMKKQYSDGSITPQGMTADLADTPVNAPSRPPLSQAKTVDKNTIQPKPINYPTSPRLPADDAQHTPPLTIQVHEDLSPLSSPNKDADGSFFDETLYQRTNNIDDEDGNQLNIPSDSMTKGAKLEHEQAMKEKAEEEQALADSLRLVQQLKDQKDKLLAEETLRKAETYQWNEYNKLRTETAATMKEAHEAFKKRKETEKLLDKLTAEVNALRTTETTRNEHLKSPPIQPDHYRNGPSEPHRGNTSPTWGERTQNDHSRFHTREDQNPRQYSRHTSFNLPPQFDPHTFPGYKDRTSSRINQAEPMEYMVQMLTQAMNNQTMAFTEALTNTRDHPRSQPEDRQPTSMNMNMASWLLPEFDGTHPENFPDFKIQFESLMAANNNNPATKLAALRRQLKGAATSALIILPDPEAAYKATMLNLEKMFGRSCDPALLEQQFEALLFNKINPTVMNIDLAKHRALAAKLLSVSPGSHLQLTRTLNNKLPSTMQMLLSMEIYDGQHTDFFAFCDRVRTAIGGLQISANSSGAPAPKEDIFTISTQPSQQTSAEDESEELTAEGETINTMYRSQMWNPPQRWRDRHHQGQNKKPMNCLICIKPEHIAIDCSLKLMERRDRVSRDGKCKICLLKDAHPEGQCPRNYKCGLCRVAHDHHSSLCGLVAVLETIRNGGADLQNITKYSEYFPTSFRQQQ